MHSRHENGGGSFPPPPAPPDQIKLWWRKGSPGSKPHPLSSSIRSSVPAPRFPILQLLAYPSSNSRISLSPSAKNQSCQVRQIDFAKGAFGDERYGQSLIILGKITIQEEGPTVRIQCLGRCFERERGRITARGESRKNEKIPKRKSHFPKLWFYRSLYSPSSPKEKSFRLGVRRKTGRVLGGTGVERFDTHRRRTAFLRTFMNKAWPEKKGRGGVLYRLAKADGPPAPPPPSNQNAHRRDETRRVVQVLYQLF